MPTRGVMAETVVGDSKYGTIENFLACHDLGVRGAYAGLRRILRKADREAEDLLRRSV